MYYLPEYVFIGQDDELKVAIWDESNQIWSTDYVEGLSYEKETRELKFTRKMFAPLAFLQSKTADFPYDSWYIRQIDNQVGLLTVKTKRIILNFEIHPLFVKLVHVHHQELKFLENQQLHPGILLMELKKCGLNLMPEDEDAERGGIHLKDKIAEERAILDIATTLKAFAFQSLKWSQQASPENIICRVRENPDNFKEFFEDDESDWKSIMWWNNKVTFIKSRNCDEVFNPEIADKCDTHSLLCLAVEGVQSQDAFEKCQYLHDIDFIDNVQRMLRLLRLLAFTTGAYDKRSLEEQQ